MVRSRLRFARAFALPLATALLAALAAGGCAPRARAPHAAPVEERTPSFLGSRAAADPSLAAAGGFVAMTWVERTPGGGGDVWLTCSSDSGRHWTEPQRLNPMTGRVSSYAESRPVIALGAPGHVAVAWAAKRDSGEYADDVMARVSRDGGATFGPPQYVNDDHADPRSTYHGFLALESRADGAWVAAWLDGRASIDSTGEPGACQVRVATSGDAGFSWAPSVVAADSACSCCRLALRGGTSGRLALAYRTARGNRRDPRLALSFDGGGSWPLDTLVSDDGWLLPGCPSHGPAVSLFAGGGQIAWFTGAAGSEGLWTATWRDDGGLDQARHAYTDGLRDAERPMLAPWGRASVAGVLGSPEGDSTRRVLGLRVLRADGRAGAWSMLGVRAKTAAIATDGVASAWACWVEQTGEGPRLRLARVGLRRDS